MKLSLYIAKRYIFSKKSHNAINVISFISVVGIAIATMATIVTLSIFNGFTDLTVKSFSTIDPDLKVTPVKGKVFEFPSPQTDQIKALEQISFIAPVIEDNALVKFNERQVPATIKGVSAEYSQLVNPDIVIDGTFLVEDGDVDFGVVGAGLAMNIGVRANYISPIEIFTPKRNVKINLANPSSAFEKVNVYPSGIFITNQEKYDNHLLFVSLDIAKQLFRYENEVSALEIRLKDSNKASSVKNEIKSILGNNFEVKDRFEQQEESFKMVNIEKWITFLILIFIIIIAVFNIIGSLSMLILDKKADIKILQNLGASNRLISNIFLFEGWLISFIGSFAGLILGVILCLLQQYFGWLKLSGDANNYIVDAYPVVVELADILIVFITVNIIGYIAVLYPVSNLKKNLSKSLTNINQ